MTKCLLYMAPIVLIGLVATEAPAAPTAWSGGIGRNITATAPEGTGVPLVLGCQRGGEAAAVLAPVAGLAPVAAAVIAAVAAVLAAVAAVPGPVPAEAISVAAA
jgi:hypothetical protein